MPYAKLLRANQTLYAGGALQYHTLVVATDNDNPSHPVLLTAVMFFVLAGSVAVAWWVSQSRHGPAAAGAEVLDLIRSRGLKAYWPAEPIQMFMIYREGNQPISWSVYYRRHEAQSASSGEAFRGIEMQATPQAVYRSDWELRDNLATSQYIGTVSRTRSALKEATTILLAKGRVEVDRVDPPDRTSAVGLAPTNYIPEDARDLIVFQVIKQQRPATFRFLQDDESIKGGRLNFGRLSVTPLEGLKARCESIIDGGAAVQVIEFSEVGEVIAVEQGPLRGTRAELEEVLQLFPDAKRILLTNKLIGAEIIVNEPAESVEL